MQIKSTVMYREIQMKSTVRYHLPAIKISITKNKLKSGNSWEKLEPSVDDNVKWYTHCKNSLVVPQGVKHRITT